MFFFIFTLYIFSGFGQLNSRESFSTFVSVFSVGLQLGVDPSTEHTPHSGSSGSRLMTTVVLESTVITIVRPSKGGIKNRVRQTAGLGCTSYL